MLHIPEQNWEDSYDNKPTPAMPKVVQSDVDSLNKNRSALSPKQSHDICPDRLNRPGYQGSSSVAGRYGELGKEKFIGSPAQTG